MGRHTLNLPLRFTGETDDRLSVYTDRYGDKVFLAHGAPWHVLVPLEDLEPINTLWYRYMADHADRFMRVRWQHFLDHLRTLVTEPEQVDELVWRCDRCETPSADDGRYSVNGGDLQWCDDCMVHARTCYHCEDSYTSTTTVAGDNEVCTRCRDLLYTRCDECDDYFRDGTHEHEEEDPTTCSTDCSSPAQQFTLPNDGDGPLANDTRVNISLPAGVISQEGLNTIRQYLYNQELYVVARFVESVGPEWQTKDGNYTKRLSRAAYNFDKVEGKIPAPALSHIGVIAREHSRTIDFDVEITRDLNLPAEEFAHEESCWWQSYHYSRCTLKSNGGFGLRTFAKGTEQGTYPDRYPEGRAWVMPLKRTGDNGNDQAILEPTFDTHEADAFFVFNGYGNLSGYVAARIIAHMVGGTYRKVSVSITPMYVNNDNGYLVGAEEIVAPYTDGHLRVGSLDQHSDLYERETTDAAQAALFEKEPAHV